MELWVMYSYPFCLVVGGWQCRRGRCYLLQVNVWCSNATCSRIHVGVTANIEDARTATLCDTSRAMQLSITTLVYCTYALQHNTKLEWICYPTSGRHDRLYVCTYVRLSSPTFHCCVINSLSDWTPARNGRFHEVANVADRTGVVDTRYRGYQSMARAGCYSTLWLLSNGGVGGRGVGDGWGGGGGVGVCVDAIWRCFTTSTIQIFAMLSSVIIIGDAW